MKFFNTFSITFLLLLLGNVVLNIIDQDYSEALAHFCLIGWYSMFRMQEIRINQLENDLYL